MTTYRYVLCDTLTGDVLDDDAPLVDVSYDVLLSGAGKCSATLPMGAVAARIAEVNAYTAPLSTTLFIIRDDVDVVWDGIVWARGYKASERALRLTGQGTWSYYRKRVIGGGDHYYDQQDQAYIVRSLWNVMETQWGAYGPYYPPGTLGIDVEAPNTGVLRDRSYLYSDQKKFGEAIEDMHDNLDGFDFVMDAYLLAGVPVRRFRLGYPDMATAFGLPVLSLEFPGNLADYALLEDATECSDSVVTIGEGQGTGRLTGAAAFLGSSGLGGEYAQPVTEEAIVMSTVSDSETLNGHAIAEVNAHRYPTRAWGLQAVVGEGTAPGDWSVGCAVDLRITDPYRFATPFATTLRLLSASVVTGDGRAPETVDFFVGLQTGVTDRIPGQSSGVGGDD